MIMKKAIFGLMLVLMTLSLAVFANAVTDQVEIEYVEVEGDELDSDSANRFDIQRGDEFSVKVRLVNTDDETLEDVQIYAFIAGFEHDDKEPISDKTDVFDMEPGVSYAKRLTLSLSDRVEEDDYRLRILIVDRNSDILSESYRLKIDVPRHAIEIKDVVLNPEYSVQAGRAVLATVRVENAGEQDQEGVRVRVAIPELNVAATDFIDDLESDDTKTSEELFLRIPCAEPGTYDVLTTVSYNDGDDQVHEESTIKVTEGSACADGSAAPSTTGKTTLTYSTEAQSVSAGGSAGVYPVSITNQGAADRIYTIAVTGVDFGTVKVSPSNVVAVGAGDTETAFVFVSASESAQAGDEMFVVTVSDAQGNKLQDLTMKATVEGSESSSTGLDLGSARNVLEIGLVVLVVLLVLIGLVVAFRRMKGPEEGETQTYY